MSATHSLAATAEMAVPFVRLDKDDPELLEELLGEVRAVAEQSAFTLGSHVEAFETDFAAYCEADEAVGVGSGTDALALALRALGIGPGHEVIVPANTFIATAEAVSVAGATPRFVDVDPATGLITAEIVERAITPRPSNSSRGPMTTARSRGRMSTTNIGSRNPPGNPRRWPIVKRANPSCVPTVFPFESTNGPRESAGASSPRRWRMILV